VTPILALSIALLPTSALACAAFARWMRRRSVGQSIRELGPRSHATKAGTPTMGGLVMLGLWIFGLLALRAWWPNARQIPFVLSAGALFGGIGWLDDALSLRRRHSRGLGVLQKLGLTTLGAIGLYFLFQDVLAIPHEVPFSSMTIVLPPAASIVLTGLVFVGTTNSLNLADGLDGFAGGLVVLILVGLMLLVPAHSQALLALPLVAAVLGFLWMNVHPAALFMGDAGSFGLGGVLAAMALASGRALLLPILAGVLVLEAVSVLAQTALVRACGVRIFKMAPFHHHFERGAAPDGRRSLLPGAEWPEAQVTLRLLILQALFVALAAWAGGLG